ncbi:hypothetical protein BASA61_009311 [Batrachochytrium salamandrivorans]|nr:hypothetical protein BASA60_000481 [Batrachochytrium salamandrivorans]KAH6574489.1 hypothetical protein BASA62_002418 [Batrachochytrium salamandrivorans]KAH6580987.1 hypothetical protein BASA61_009311 [Batrachochytrium salamandrivorans]
MSVFGLGRQGRVLVAQLGETERSRWIVGSCGLKQDNEIHLIDYDEDEDEITHAVYSHPDEVLSIAPSPTKADLFFSCARKVEDRASTLHTTLWRFPNIDSDTSGKLKGGGKNPLEEIAVFSPTIGLPDIHQILWEPSGTLSQVVGLGSHRIGIYALGESDLNLILDKEVSIQASGETNIGCGAWDPHHISQIAVGSGTSIIGWDIRGNSECFRIPNAHELPMRTLDYNPNKPYHMVSGGDDCTVRIWDTRNSNTWLKSISDHSHWIWSASFNKFHDQLLLSSSSDCRVNLDSVVSVSSVFLNSGTRVLSSNSSDGGHLDDSDDYDSGEYHSNKAIDGLIASFDHHEEAVYSVSWSAADPWIFASLSYDGRLVVNQVPKEEKYKIMDC